MDKYLRVLGFVENHFALKGEKKWKSKQEETNEDFRTVRNATGLAQRDRPRRACRAAEGGARPAKW